MSARSRQPGGTSSGPGGGGAAAAGKARDTPRTRVPAPGRALTSPSSASRWYASTITPRETPRSPASSRVAGSGVPAPSRPSMMAARMASASQPVSPRTGAAAGLSWRKSAPVIGPL